MKPASKAPGLHGVFMRDKVFKFVIADSASAPARAGSILASIIGALHFGQAGRPIAANGMADERL